MAGLHDTDRGCGLTSPSTGESEEEEHCGRELRTEGSQCRKEDDESEAEKLCRFCLCSDGEDLISPCRCKGTQKYVHRSCLNEWRATKGRFAFANCCTCRAGFHLRIPRDLPRSFLVGGASRLALQLAAATLMFTCVQLLAVAWGYVLGRSSDLPSFSARHLDLNSRRALFCYCVGIWEVLFVVVVSNNHLILRLDNWFWRGSYFGATSVLQYSLFPLVAETVFQACELHRTALHHLPPPIPRSLTSPMALLPRLPLRPVPPLPLPLSLLCDSRILEATCMGACSLFALGVVLSLALGVLLGGYAGYGLLVVMESNAPQLSTPLVEAVEVLDVAGEYEPPKFSASEQRVLQTLRLLT